MSMLSKGKQKIDVIILNVRLSNSSFVDLLAQAEALNIISLAVCDEFNEFVAKKTLDDGAYLYLKKPFNKEILIYLWQFVLAERKRKEKASEGSRKHKDQMKVNMIKNKESEENIGKYTLKRKKGTKGMQNNAIDKVVTRKDYKEWTKDLHAAFMQAVSQLGEGRCYPKEILQAMNLPDLTRMQVASHLQKCRRNNWRSPEERKNIRRRSTKRRTVTFEEPKSNFRKFGVMPSPQANVPNQQWNPFPTHNTNNIFTQRESSIQRQQLYRPQFQVQPHYLSIDNSFLFSQTNNGENHSGKNYNSNLNVAQGATPIMPATYIQNAIINNYNLNVNNVTTYSSRGMMPNAYVGNVTINGMGATNANASSQQYVGEPIMNGPRNIDVAPYENYVEGSNSNKKENRDVYLNFNNMDSLFQNLGPSSANLPSELDTEFDQVYSDDQDLGPPNANLPNAQGNELDQVYSNIQNLETPSANLPNEQGSQFGQVYSDEQNRGSLSANLPNEQDNEFDQVYSDD
nr:putative two-component response regulator ARR13 [Solanum lycopersicum]